MKDFNIYLAGGMQNLSFDVSNIWRNNVIKSFKNVYSYSNVKCINPNDYYNFKEITYDSQHEVMDFDLYKVRHSDLVIVNLNDVKSIGTAMELAVAHENGIPIIGLNEEHNELHPWESCMCNKIFHNMQKMVRYIADYYLN